VENGQNLYKAMQSPVLAVGAQFSQRLSALGAKGLDAIAES